MKDILLRAIPGFAGSMALELAASVFVKRERPLYETRDAVTSVAMGLGNLFIELVNQRVMTRSVHAFFWKHRLFDVPLKGWKRRVALTIADDFLYYWFHRWGHEMRVLWASHVNHHSSEFYNLSTALRQSWTAPWAKMPFSIPLLLSGFTPEEVADAQSWNLLYQFWIHTELIDRIGPLEAILNSPSHHRAHHGANLEYLDRNYGGIFIIWDRLFGTFEPERAEVEYGLLKNIRTHNLWEVAFHEFSAMLRDVAKAPSWGQKLAHFFKPPGWSADGSSLTVGEMRAKQAESVAA